MTDLIATLRNPLGKPEHTLAQARHDAADIIEAQAEQIRVLREALEKERHVSAKFEARTQRLMQQRNDLRDALETAEALLVGHGKPVDQAITAALEATK